MMSFPNDIEHRLWTLTNAVCDKTISEQEFHELELLLQSDPAAREFFVDLFKVNSELSWLISAKQYDSREPGTQTSPALPSQSPALGLFGNSTNFFNQYSPTIFYIAFRNLWSNVYRDGIFYE